MMTPAPFAFAGVASSSPINGQSSYYTFTLTLSVDTDIGAMIQITPPDDVIFDNSNPFLCMGVMNTNYTLNCKNRNSKTFFIRMDSNDHSLNTYNMTNGTTLIIMLGPFINPLSFMPSGSFQVTTFETSSNGIVYYYINREATSLTI